MDSHLSAFKSAVHYLAIPAFLPPELQIDDYFHKLLPMYDSYSGADKKEIFKLRKDLEAGDVKSFYLGFRKFEGLDKKNATRLLAALNLSTNVCLKKNNSDLLKDSYKLIQNVILDDAHRREINKDELQVVPSKFDFDSPQAKKICKDLEPKPISLNVKAFALGVFGIALYRFEQSRNNPFKDLTRTAGASPLVSTTLVSSALNFSSNVVMTFLKYSPLIVPAGAVYYYTPVGTVINGKIKETKIFKAAKKCYEYIQKKKITIPFVEGNFKLSLIKLVVVSAKYSALLLATNYIVKLPVVVHLGAGFVGWKYRDQLFKRAF